MAVAPFLFVLVGVLCEFAMVPGVYTFYCSLRKRRYTVLPERRCTHSAPYSSKRFKPLSDIWLCWKVMNWKKHKQGIQLCLVLIICFKFQWMSFSNLFLRVSNLIWVVLVWLLILRHKWPNDFESFLTPCRWIKTWVQRPPNIFQMV